MLGGDRTTLRSQWYPPQVTEAEFRLRGILPAARGLLTDTEARQTIPEAEYELPLLGALVELDGSAPTADVIDLLGQKLKGKLTDVDRETINSGEIRWRNRVQFVRLGLIKEGLMAKDSPRGVWEITDEGRARVAQAGASA